jgi:hypothetical protein
MRRLEKPKWQIEKEKKMWFWLKTIVSVLVLIPLLAIGYVFLTKPEWNIFNRFDKIEYSDKTYTVANSLQLQDALNKAQPGETILLKAGETFKGVFKLPNKNGKDFITIRTSAADSQLPPPDTRIDPKKYASVLPKIVANEKGEPAIKAVNGASYYRFIGVEFGPTIEGFYNIIQLGTTEEKNVSELPHHIEFDRIYVHGDPKYGQRRGIAANGRNIVIKNSYFSGIVREGEESQAIAIWGTDGPVEITNNYLEAGGENIIFGGAGSNLKLVPTDCIVRDNWMNKLVEWRDKPWVVKNIYEIKNGRRIKTTNNLLTNNWLMAQDGTAVLFTTRADNGKDTIIEDIEFSNNVVRGAGNAINIYGEEGSGGHHLTIRNNIFDDINSKKWGGNGFFLKTTNWDGVTIENNTVIQDGNIALAYDKPLKNFIFRNNIVFHNDYGFIGDSTAIGKPTLLKFFPNSVVSNNIIIGGKPEILGEQNFYPDSLNQIGFANLEKHDYRLRNDSKYLTKGFGGKSIGANLDEKTVGGK